MATSCGTSAATPCTPSTLQLLDELGLGERFAKLPQSKLHELAFPIDEHRSVVVGDFRRLTVSHPYIAMVPQWDLLNLLAEAGAEEPSYTLRMRTEVTELIRESGRVRGVRYRTEDGTTGEVRADLTVACDGRWSLARRQAGLRPKELPMPLGVWWFRLSHNLAVQDAVAAATLLAEPLRRGALTPATLAKVRARRLLPTIAVQSLQRLMHRAFVVPILKGQRMGPPKPVVAVITARPASVVHTGLPHRHRATARTRAGLRQAPSSEFAQVVSAGHAQRTEQGFLLVSRPRCEVQRVGVTEALPVAEQDAPDAVDADRRAGLVAQVVDELT
ncbi:MAG: FAD-dependent monooxygenase, partial [Pseudonocardiaceae bacterium]